MQIFEELRAPIQPLDIEATTRAKRRQNSLTKPDGSLGLLEKIAIDLAAMQSTEQPVVDRISIHIFAADHGIVEESVSAFPQSVTGEMVRNFLNGGAAINVIANQLGARLEIIDVGIKVALPQHPGLIVSRAGSSTENFIRQAAMKKDQLSNALSTGRESVNRALANRAQLFIGGEMGIANTTAASALACALLEQSPDQLVGPGTGLDSKGIQHKKQVVQQALNFHKRSSNNPYLILQNLGGFEIAALVGAYIQCAQYGLPILIDGFICSVAALLASKISPGSTNWFVYAHKSHEPGHQIVLKALNAEPLLDLSMRLGEASGAGVAVPLLRMACALHNGMATFHQAQVSSAC